MYGPCREPEQTLILFLLLALQSTHLPAQSARPPQAPRPLVLTHVTVVDATGAPAQSDRTVVITGGRIAELGPSASVQVPKDVQVIDARGKFLIPGLWDMFILQLVVCRDTRLASSRPSPFSRPEYIHVGAKTA